MAKFDIIEQEGVRLIKVTLANEMVRTESGALYYMRGPITMESKAPSIGGFFKAVATGETIFRPTYTGSGELFLEPSLGGFHVFEVGNSEWILEDGAYWASESTVTVDIHREKALTAFKSGEGFLDFQTKLGGSGKVVLNAQGPVEVVQLQNDKLVVDGRYVVARQSCIQYSVQRAAKSLLGSVTSGEGLVRIYEGSGTLLMAPIPFWRHRLHQSLAALGSRQSG
ncbi:MAG: AIM24 family protein [Verrucomicrobia bacterium]|nr:AIM24 family protein [Verrucomicrobiota bacterium]